jgi:hypothetical protein
MLTLRQHSPKKHYYKASEAEGLHDAVARGEAAPASCRVKIDGRRGNNGVVFPDLPGCTAMGRTIEEALHHAMEASEWAEVKSCPCPQIELTMRQAADLFMCVAAVPRLDPTRPRLVWCAHAEPVALTARGKPLLDWLQRVELIEDDKYCDRILAQ